MNKLLPAIAALAVVTGAGVATSASAVPVLYSFGTPSGNLGATHTYTDGGSGRSVVASGFDFSNAATDLFGKNAGGNEVGLGLNNDPTGDTEIHFESGFVQLDVLDLIGKVNPLATFFSMNSSTFGEQWGVFGSNVAGSHGGVALLTLGDEASHLLPSFGAFRYYDFVEVNHTPGQGDNVLLHTLSTETVGIPEPATWAMMLIGFGGLGGLFRRRRAAASLQAA